MMLITGASGRVGRPLVDGLLSAGHRLRVVTRRAAAASELKEAGATVVLGDLSEDRTVDRAVRGANRIFLLSSAHPDMPRIHRKVIDAAGNYGVEHVVRVSTRGASLGSRVNIRRWHAEADDYLRQSGVAWTILKPDLYQQTLLRWAHEVANTGTFSAAGRGKSAYIDARDVAAAAQAALTRPGHRGQEYELTGPRVYDLDHVRLAIAAAIRRPVKLVQTTRSDWIRRLNDEHGCAWLASDQVAVHENDTGAPTEHVARLTGLPPRELEDFLIEHCGLFGALEAAAAVDAEAT